MQKYMPILDSTLRENTILNFDLYLQAHENGTSRYILFTRGNEQFSSERKEMLLRARSKELFISTKDIHKYFIYQEKNLKYFIEGKRKTSLEKSRMVYQVANNLIEDIMSDPGANNNVERAAEWIKNTIYYILNDENTYSSFFQIADHDYNLYSHSINVSVIGLLFGKFLALKQEDLNSLGKGLLLHDIGKIEVPLEILNKPGKLTEDEFYLLKKHPEAGLRLLEGKENIGNDTLSVVAQHHENYNGTGYPNGIAEDDIHLFGKICRIIDVYDALTSKRTHSNAMKPFVALAEMKEKMMDCFDMVLFKKFIYFLGPRNSRSNQRTVSTLSSRPSPSVIRHAPQSKKYVYA